MLHLQSILNDRYPYIIANENVFHVHYCCNGEPLSVRAERNRSRMLCHVLHGPTEANLV